MKKRWYRLCIRFGQQIEKITERKCEIIGKEEERCRTKKYWISLNRLDRMVCVTVTNYCARLDGIDSWMNDERAVSRVRALCFLSNVLTFVFGTGCKDTSKWKRWHPLPKKLETSWLIQFLAIISITFLESLNGRLHREISFIITLYLVYKAVRLLRIAVS